MEQKGSTPAWQAVAEIELVYKTNVKAKDRPVITGSKDAYTVLMMIWDRGTIDLQEQFKVLLLNRANKVLGVYHVSSGGVTGTVADPKLVFAAALKANACSMILAHNHPSGNMKPSKADIELTQKIAEGARLFDMKVLDHLVVHTDTYFSFADGGLL